MYGCRLSVRYYSPFDGYLPLCWILILTALPYSLTDCPSKAQQKAFSCLNDYNRDYLNMLKSQRTLFTGVDVEVLRAFCSSYIYAMSCIKLLKAECPPEVDRQIDITQRNLEGAKHELSELCEDDRLYELYARHMTCFEASGSQSERCYKTIMNRTAGLMTKFPHKSQYEICLDLRRVQHCIRENIENNCGSEAGSLVNVLVKPMVWRSTKCDSYKVISTSGNKENRSPTSTTSTKDHVIHIIDTSAYRGGQTNMSDRQIHWIIITVLCILYIYMPRNL